MLIGLFLISLTPITLAGGNIALVAGGKPTAAIVIAADAEAGSKRAVTDLVDCVQESTGATLPVEQASREDRIELHIGNTEYVRSLNLKLDTLGVDGFKILFPAPNRIALVGGSDSGTEFAIYEFLERYVGVRWLFPGECGTHIPKTMDVLISTDEVVSRPQIISRTISTVQGADEGESVFLWLQRHRRHWTINHHHNLDKLFPPKELMESHPEFYPMVKGKRVEPDADAQNWQPMFDAPGIVDEAVKRISAYFDSNPNSTSYSLGINDGNNFGVPARRLNSVGLGDYSDRYFRFTNEVIDGVLKKHPDKWFGCLAYVGITDPPTEVGVHPRLVPHICIDRYGWSNEADAQRDMQRTRDWQRAAPVLGWYDYIYGDDMYRIPRIYPHVMARYLKFGAEQGVKAYYAEYYGAQAWVDGPKMYLLMKLLWDPNTDVDATLNEWYRLAVGEDAAAPLSKYYAFWEDYWTTRVPKTDWFHQYANRVYFDFDQLGYLDPLTVEDLAACRRLLDEVVARAESPEQKQRAKFVSKGFDDLRKNVEYHVRLKDRTATLDPAKPAILADSFVPPAGANLTPAEGEKVPAPWGGWQNEPGTAKIYWDHQNGQTDSHCVAVDAEGAGSSVVFYRDFPVDKPESLYHMSAAVQVNDVNPDANIGIEIRWNRQDGKYLPRKYTANSYHSAALYQQGQWVQLDVFSQPPADVGPLTMSIRLAAVYPKKGTIRFDDVNLSAVQENQTRAK
jgi:hypothetical protein